MRLVGNSLAIIGFVFVACGVAAAQQTTTAADTVARVDWTQSYDAGYTDGNGAYAGGS